MSDAQKYNRLHGARILVIGGSSGLGFTAAEASLESGAGAVVISSSNSSRISDAVSRIQKSYPSLASRVTGQACNLGDGEKLEANLKELLDFATKDGKLDHIIYTAGDRLAMMKVAELEFSKVVQAGMVRFFGPLMLAKLAPSYMNPGPKSSIILTTGSVSRKPRPDWTVVNSYASGLHGMTRGLALDLKPIRVNLVSPGAVETELWGHMSKEQFEGMKKGLQGSLPTGRLAQPEDVAEAYLYLMKDQNITGEVVQSDSGGMLV